MCLSGVRLSRIESGIFSSESLLLRLHCLFLFFCSNFLLLDSSFLFKADWLIFSGDSSSSLLHSDSLLLSTMIFGGGSGFLFKTNLLSFFLDRRDSFLQLNFFLRSKFGRDFFLVNELSFSSSLLSCNPLLIDANLLLLSFL